jgi:hypothetical protein
LFFRLCNKIFFKTLLNVLMGWLGIPCTNNLNYSQSKSKNSDNCDNQFIIFESRCNLKKLLSCGT